MSSPQNKMTALMTNMDESQQQLLVEQELANERAASLEVQEHELAEENKTAEDQEIMATKELVNQYDMTAVQQQHRNQQHHAYERHVTPIASNNHDLHHATAMYVNYQAASPTPSIPDMAGPAGNRSTQDAAQQFGGGVLSVDSWMTQRIVVLAIGRERQKWAVHETLISNKSPYLKRVLEDNAAAGCKEIVLEDTDPKLFAMLLRWIYSTAFANSGGNRVFRYPIPDGVRHSVTDFLGLYILGGQLEIPGVKNAAIDAVYAYYHEETTEARCPNLHDVQMIFDNTPPESHMRRLLIAHALFFLFSKKRGNGLPAEWQEVMLQNGQIGWSMLQMLADWRWVMGSNVPPMRIKNRQAFHEPIVIDLENVKMEEAD